MPNRDHADHPEPRPGRFQLLLHRADQLTIAVIILGCSVAMLLYLWHQWQVRRGLIDVDRAARIRAEFLVDINAADWPEISNLPGIGEQLARSIVAHREVNGPYHSIDQLAEIRGIGEGKIRQVRPYLVPISGADRLLVQQ